jgi:histidinol dehydrogenase
MSAKTVMPEDLMFKVYNSQIARESLLKRTPLDEMEVSPAVLKSIEQIFGAPLSPTEVVDRIIKDVRMRGDLALREWTERLDHRSDEEMRVSQQEIDNSLDVLSQEQRNALETSIDRVKRFHQEQPVTTWITQSLGGTLGQLVRPIERVGLYVPAGSAPLPSSVIMSAVPAQVAGVKQIVLVAPPDRSLGKIAPIILATAALLGINEVYSIGGAQAIAALAFGTQSIHRVDKIFGPGNLFVTLAKRQVYGMVGIDSLAGPTETIVLADEHANPDWVAADLFAQAEHDPLAAAILLTPSRKLVEKVQVCAAEQLKNLDRATIITTSLQNRSGIVLTSSLDEAIELANLYAPEHLCLAVKDPWQLLPKITAAGGVFMGEHSFEVLGDYVAGPSHVMPTNGSARFSSPLNVLDFIHLVSLVALDSETSSSISVSAAVIAKSEGLTAHAKAAEKRV